MKQTKLLLATIAMLWCSLTASAHDFEVGGIYYYITSKTDLTVKVTYQGGHYNSYSNEYSGAVTIPAAVTYNGKTYSVASIGYSAFRDCSSLTSITIPEGVTSIEESAFDGCSSLTSITIPEGVTSIGDYAFDGCSSLTSITIPEGVTSIGDYAFWSCYSLYKVINCSNLGISKGSTAYGYVAYYAKKVLNGNNLSTVGDYQFYTSNGVHYLANYSGNDSNLVLPDSYNGENYKIADYAFYGCSSLTAITIPESVTSIGQSVFCRCSSLTSITIPESVTSIENYAFEGCRSLTTINIPEGVTSIGNYAFNGCSRLTAITIPEGVTSIGDEAFRNCNSLTSITIPEGVTSIGDETFLNCYSLTSITIPESVTSIGNYAFHLCSSLTAITIPEGVTSIGESAFSYCSNLTSITIPESVTSIRNYAFNECTSLKELVIEDGNETLSLGYNEYYSNKIGEGLFYDCPLETIYLGRNLSYDNDYQHGYSPFYNKKALTSVTIGDGVTSIGSSAFWDCTSLTSITIPEGVTSIGSSAFSGCNSLTSIIVEGGNTTYDSRNNCNAIIETSGNCLIVGCSTTIIPEGVTSIGYEAFRGCSRLTSITIPESVTSIGNGAFIGCTSLKELVIEDGSKTLSLGYKYYYSNGTGEGLFYDCPLETIYLGRNLSYSSDQSYGYSPFYNKKALTSVTIGESVTSIQDYAFNGCSNLTSITIPEGVTSIGYYAFSGTTWYANQSDGVIYINKVLYTYKGTMPENTSIEVKEGTISISPCAFEYCRSLTTITIPEGVTSIGNWAFYDCSSLTSITIPESMTRIDYEAFYGCTSLTSVHIKDIASWCNIDFYGYKANPLYYAKNLYLNGELVTELTIPNTATAIKDYAFFCCSSLTSITIPESVTRIYYEAFYGCTSLKELVIEDGNETLSLGYNEYYSNKIGEGLFYDCPLETIYWGRNLSYSSGKSYGYSPFYNQKALTSVTIGESVTEIGDYAFCDCSSLTSITIPENSKLRSIGESTFRGCSSLPSIAIPESVTRIDYEAFYGCTSLKELVIEDGNETLSLGYNEYYSNKIESLFYDCPLETIYWGRNLSYSSGKSYGYSPFYNQKALTSVTIGESVTEIGDYAFCDCSSLTSITIPENSKLRSIGGSAFDGCSSLPSIAIPESVTSIGEYAFYNCTSLTSVHIKDIASWCNISFGDSRSNPLYYANKLYLNGELVTELTIPNTVTAIKSYAFVGCSSLTSVTIPESVTSIGNIAFYECSGLTSITIPENLQLTSIGQSVFCRCSSLTSITIPESVTSIGDWAFSDCSSLTSITIPESSQLTSIGLYAFKGCSSLTSIIIPESVRSIGLYAFKGCSSLTSITLSEGVTSIGDDSFSGCSNVENLVVKGSAMPYVPSDKLKKIVLYSPAPLQSKGFSSTVYQNCMLYVPQQGLARYQIVEPWAYFWNIIAFDTSDIAPAELPEDDSAPIIYDLRGQRVDVPTRGNIYIVNGRKVLY